MAQLRRERTAREVDRREAATVLAAARARRDQAVDHPGSQQRGQQADQDQRGGVQPQPITRRASAGRNRAPRTAGNTVTKSTAAYTKAIVSARLPTSGLNRLLLTKF